MRFYIADCHFYHTALNLYMDKRGFNSVEEMNAFMIQQWNNVVRKNDEVVILGDFSWAGAHETELILEQLNGKKFLITGNHDRYLKDKTFDTSKYFAWVKPYEELSDNNRKVILSHYPMPFYNGQYRLDENGNAKTYMLYGHIHNTHDQQLMDQFIQTIQQTKVKDPGGLMRTIPCQCINVFTQYSNYKPLTLDQWIENDAKRKK